MFRTYLKTQGVTEFPIAKFEGNRFNIVFYNAAGIYLRHHLVGYLEEVHHTQNKVLQAVLRDLKHPLYRMNQIKSTVANMMVEKNLNELLEAYRAEILPDVGMTSHQINKLHFQR